MPIQPTEPIVVIPSKPAVTATTVEIGDNIVIKRKSKTILFDINYLAGSTITKTETVEIKNIPQIKKGIQELLTYNSGAKTITLTHTPIAGTVKIEFRPNVSISGKVITYADTNPTVPEHVKVSYSYVESEANNYFDTIIGSTEGQAIYSGIKTLLYNYLIGTNKVSGSIE